MLDNVVTKPSKYRTKNWSQINDNACGTYNTNSQIKGTFSSLTQSLATKNALKIIIFLSL